MSASITIIETDQSLPAALSTDLAPAIDLGKAEKALSTRKAYGTDFRIFKAWCDGKGVGSLTAHYHLIRVPALEESLRTSDDVS
jgi:hypothetical protein